MNRPPDFFPIPFLPLSSCQTFLSSHFHTDLLSRLGLDNQVASTSDHLANCYLPSTPKDQSTMRTELTEKLRIEVVGIFYAQRTLELGNYPDRAGEYGIEQTDRKVCM